MTGPNLSGDLVALRLLATLLRWQPTTRAGLREIRGLPVSDLDAVLDKLIQAGFVADDGGRLTYHPPDRAVEAKATELAQLIRLLPELSREWHQGTPRSSTLDAEFVHGHEEQWRAWARQAALTPPRAPLNLYPALDVLRDIITPGLSDAVSPYRQAMRAARAVIPAAAVVTAADRAIVDAIAAVGMEVRLARRVESWLYSDPEVLCGLPVVWGEHPPTSIVIVRDPSIRAVTAAYAERIWASSAPYRVPRPEWHDVLRLLALGMSDRAIAAAQGTSQRTVERRIAEAMAHYQVGTRFELGVAWSSEHVDKG